MWRRLPGVSSPAEVLPRERAGPCSAAPDDHRRGSAPATVQDRRDARSPGRLHRWRVQLRRPLVSLHSREAGGKDEPQDQSGRACGLPLADQGCLHLRLALTSSTDPTVMRRADREWRILQDTLGILQQGFFEEPEGQQAEEIAKMRVCPVVQPSFRPWSDRSGDLGTYPPLQPAPNIGLGAGSHRIG